MKRTVPPLLLLLLLLLAIPARAQLPHLFAGKWGSSGTGPGQFDFPAGLAVDLAGNVYVADSNNNRIEKFDSGGGILTIWGSYGAGIGQLNGPNDLVVSPSAFPNVYVCDTSNHRIQSFLRNGQYVTQWGSAGTGSGQFNYPRGIALNSLYQLYVVDTGNNRIQKFDTNGTFILQWGSSGSANGQFSFPWGVAIGPGDEVYVTDRNNNRVQKFGVDGAFILSWGSSGGGDGSFVSPRGIATGPTGDVYVADSGNFRVQRFDPSGAFVESFGSAGSLNGQLDEPNGIWVDGNGTVYVTDRNHRVNKFATPPGIVAVEDVPGDQGGHVRIRFNRSSLDNGAASHTVFQYEAFRRIDLLSTASRPLDRGRADPAPDSTPPLGALISGWEFVGAVPAHGEPEYTLLAPTAADSTVSSGMAWSVFFIRAATGEPGIFLDSAADSGYSTDDLAPSAPPGFMLASTTAQGDVELSWGESQESDFRYYSLYRDTEPSFTPGPSNRIAMLVETTYMDPGAGHVALQLYYKLTATDFAGNEGDASAVSVAVTGVGYPATTYRLYTSFPNPLRDTATIIFDLPAPGRARLRIFDAGGRLVRRALDGVAPLPAGRHAWVWNRKADDGRRVPAGVYLYRLDTAGGSFLGKTVVAD